VNYSGVAPRIPEGGKFGVDLPGAPDTVRWHTGQSGAPDQGSLRLYFCSIICVGQFNHQNYLGKGVSIFPFQASITKKGEIERKIGSNLFLNNFGG
jgi:hypothetical protein